MFCIINIPLSLPVPLSVHVFNVSLYTSLYLSVHKATRGEPDRARVSPERQRRCAFVSVFGVIYHDQNMVTR